MANPTAIPRKENLRKRILKTIISKFSTIQMIFIILIPEFLSKTNIIHFFFNFVSKSINEEVSALPVGNHFGSGIFLRSGERFNIIQKHSGSRSTR